MGPVFNSYRVGFMFGGNRLGGNPPESLGAYLSLFVADPVGGFGGKSHGFA